ncbi:Non-specific lipid-transfer protein, partial [Linum perenne]
RSTADRQAACRCLKTFAAAVSGINYGLAGGLPGKCGVNIGFPISPSVNCNTSSHRRRPPATVHPCRPPATIFRRLFPVPFSGDFFDNFFGEFSDEAPETDQTPLTCFPVTFPARLRRPTKLR